MLHSTLAPAQEGTLIALWASLALAADPRFALVIGADEGAPGEMPLQFAEEDAQRVAGVLQQAGDVPPEEIIYLAGPTAEEVRGVLDRLTERIASRNQERALLFVYYSGHADAQALHLGPTRLPLDELTRRVKSIDVDARVLVLDACRTGELTRRKGGVQAPAFDLTVEDTLSTSGMAILTSAAQGEDAQESDRLRGGVFTHHLVAGLYGAADTSGDLRVTLNEAYDYAYARTVAATSLAPVVQHPSFSLRAAAGSLRPGHPSPRRWGRDGVCRRRRRSGLPRHPRAPPQPGRTARPALGDAGLHGARAQRHHLAHRLLRPHRPGAGRRDRLVPEHRHRAVHGGPGCCGGRRGLHPVLLRGSGDGRPGLRTRLGEPPAAGRTGARAAAVSRSRGRHGRGGRQLRGGRHVLARGGDPSLRATGGGRVALPMLLLACDGVVDDAYLGEALFRLEGWVNLTEGAASAYDLESANVGLVYAQGPETRPLFITRGVETESWFPSGYAIDLYLPPPVEAYMEGPTGTPDEGIPVVVAVPVVWEDLDGDGKLGTDESVIGAPADVGVRWEPDNQQYALSGSMGCGVDPADYDPLELDLLVGAVFCEWIYDPDCDGRKDEWGPTCPPPAEGDTASPDPPE